MTLLVFRLFDEYVKDPKILELRLKVARYMVEIYTWNARDDVPAQIRKGNAGHFPTFPDPTAPTSSITKNLQPWDERYLKKWWKIQQIDTLSEQEEFCQLAIELSCNIIPWIIVTEIRDERKNFGLYDDPIADKDGKYKNLGEEKFAYWLHSGERFFEKYNQTQFEGKIPMKRYPSLKHWLYG